jgi:hypothetical protein
MGRNEGDESALRKRQSTGKLGGTSLFFCVGLKLKDFKRIAGMSREDHIRLSEGLG